MSSDSGDRLQIEDGFGPHIEEEIYDAEVREEAQALCKHLIVGVATLLQGCHVLMYIDEIADDFVEGGVEVDEVVVGSRNIKRREFIGIVLKEWTLSVSCAQGVPVVVAPFSVLADTDVANGYMTGGRLNRDNQMGWAIGHRDCAPVANGLFHVVFIGIDEFIGCRTEIAIPRDGGKVGGGQWEKLRVES